MTDAKKQEVTNKSEDPKKPQAAVINNPFDAYKSNPTTPAPTNKEQKRKSSSSPEYRSDPSEDKGERSRSRDNKQKPRASKQRKEEPYAQKKNKEIPQSKNSESEKDEITNQQMPKDETKNDEAAYVKTKLCPLFDKGACKKGSACNYAHGEKELRGLPNFRKTRLCIPFKNGECSKSSNECKYAHGQNQLKKLVYDYFPAKHQQNYQNRGERQDRNHERYDNRRFRERSRERQYRQHRDYSRDRERHRDYRQRDRERQRDRDRDRERDRQRDRDRYHKDYHSSRNNSSIPPVPYPGYMPNYNSAYMIPPSSMNPYGHPGQLYPPVSNSNSGLGGSNVPGSPSFSSSVAPNLSGNPYPPGPPLYGMGPAYDYSYGFMGQNYPPYNGSTV